MNKKIFYFTFILIIVSNLIFASSNSLNIYEDTILPSNNQIGEIVFSDYNSIESKVISMLESEYSLNWIEDNVKDEYKYSFTKENSQKLLDLLPIEGNIYCSKVKNFANNRSLSVLYNKDQVINIILDYNEDKLIAINFI